MFPETKFIFVAKSFHLFLLQDKKFPIVACFAFEAVNIKEKLATEGNTLRQVETVFWCGQLVVSQSVVAGCLKILANHYGEERKLNKESFRNIKLQSTIYGAHIAEAILHRMIL